MATRIKNKVKIAVDSSTVIDLFTLIHPKNDIDGKVMQALQQLHRTDEHTQQPS